jgi:hypothetical protein
VTIFEKFRDVTFWKNSQKLGEAPSAKNFEGTKIYGTGAWSALRRSHLRCPVITWPFSQNVTHAKKGLHVLGSRGVREPLIKILSLSIQACPMQSP